MKKPSKPIIVLLVTVMILNLFTAVSFPANGAEVDMGSSSVSEIAGDYEYMVNEDGTATITSYEGSASNVVIPSTLDGHTVTALAGSVFRDNDDLYSVTIPDTVRRIKDGGVYLKDYYEERKATAIICYCQAELVGCFAGCNNLRTVNLGRGLETIGDFAFADCDSLVNITIPEKVTRIGLGAFSCCDSLQNVEILGPARLYSSEYDLSYFAWIPPEDEDRNVWLEEIPCEIDYAKGVFQNCKKLKNVSFSYSGIAEDYSWWIYEIGEDSFRGCESLTSVNIPDYVESIGEDAFYGCSSLTSIDIPDSVERIGRYAFGGCSSLTSVTVNCPSIPSYLFDRRRSLENVTLGDSVTSVGEKAFHDCTSLKSITIPKSVKYIGDKAFGFYYDVIGSQTHSTQLKNFHIYGYRDTVAELYATDNDFFFTALDNMEQKIGDADGDGDVTVMDVTNVQRFILSSNSKPDETMLQYADINKDGVIEIIDATFIQRHITGIEIPYKIG